MPSSGGQTCALDRKSTRLNSSHGSISYAVFCLKNKRIHSRRKQPIHVADCTRFLNINISTNSGKQAITDCRRKVETGHIKKDFFFFFFKDAGTTKIFSLSLPSAFPI